MSSDDDVQVVEGLTLASALSERAPAELADSLRRTCGQDTLLMAYQAGLTVNGYTPDDDAYGGHDYFDYADE